MKRNTIFLLFSLIGFIVPSCITTTSTFQVSKIGEEPADSKEKIVYVLPQTILYVMINFEKETYIPGPYRIFAQKYLGMKSEIDETSFSYRIIGTDVSSTMEPDGSQFYSINVISGSPDLKQFLKLGSEGLIVDPSELYSFKTYSQRQNETRDMPFFTDLSVKRNLRETTDTLYKTMLTDSSFVRIPVVRKQKEAKTIEQKAEEAANFIIKIRKRRFKLLAGQYDVFPEGEALQVSMNELDKLEKEYIELFLGKTIKQQFTRSFVVTPEASAQKQSLTIARFSEQSGLIDKEKKEGAEVSVEIQPLNKVAALRPAGAKYPDATMENNLFYRVPDLADVRVKVATSILYEGRTSIYQAGTMINLPVGQ